MKTLENIFWLGIKELRSLLGDVVMVVFVVYAFTLAIYVQATGTSTEVNNASIAFVDEDRSALSKELFNAFYPPRFKFHEIITAGDVEKDMDRGLYMFVVVIPPLFEHDLRAGRNPDVQVNVDATAMGQASIGAGYIRNIVNDRIRTYLRRTEVTGPQPVNLVIRKLFNPNSISSWFKSIVAIINQITLLTVVLTGAAVIREREHGTLEHLLVMPLTSFEIAMAKVWANSLVIMVATAGSLYLIVDLALKVPFAGSVVLWFVGVVLYLFFATALGLYLGTISRSMAQFALDHSGGSGADASFGGKYARREPTAMVTISHLFVAGAAFCQLFAGDYLSGGRNERGLASIPDGERDRAWLLRLQSVALP